MSGANNPQFGKHGNEHPRYGDNHTEESKQKISIALTDKPHSKEHIKHSSTTYKVQREDNLSLCIGYGLFEFSKAINLSPSSFLYTLTSGKFRNGYKIVENLGKPTNDTLPLIYYL